MAGRWLGCGFAVVVSLFTAGCPWFKSSPPEIVLHEPGSDERAADFQRNWLPRMMLDAFENFNPDSVARDFSRLALDASRLVLLEPSAVRVYFVASQGGYQSALGYWLDGEDIEYPGPYVIFPNASSPMKLAQCAQVVKGTPDASGTYYFGARNGGAPVLPGEFVDLGILPAGTQIGFFLISDAVNGEKGRFTTMIDLNPDAVQHVVTVAYHKSPYLMLAFEDLMGGGDKTYNDVVFTVEMSQSSIEALTDAQKQREAAELLKRRAHRREIRKRITKIVFAVMVFGGPLFFWAFRKYLRRRRIMRAYAQARAFLEAGNPRDALLMIREAERRGASGSMRARWAEVEVEACKQVRDASHLQHLFDYHPAAVLNDEAASLMVARAQLEIDQTDSFQTLRGAWQEKEAAPWAWLTLESDYLVRLEKPLDAEALLRQQRFAGPHDAVRLARLAELFLPSAPQDARKALGHALQLAPKEPEVHRSRARILERVGRFDESDEAWRAAITCSGGELFHRDHYAEFLVRRGQYAQALEIWREALPAPSSDIVWLKAYFWDRVTAPADIAWNTLEIPPGPLRPLLERLLRLPREIFWHAESVDSVAQQHPEALEHPECVWLRVLQSLLDSREEDVLALLATTRAGTRRYFDTLEVALRQAITYRRVQFLNPKLSIIGPETPAAWATAFFQRLDAWARGGGEEYPDDLADRFSSPHACADIFAAVGWRAAADALRKQE